MKAKRIGAYLVLLVILISSSFHDYRIARDSRGIDIRDKTVASRTLWTENSMYFSWWKKGDDIYYYDFLDNQATALSRFTGTPFQAVVMKPLSLLPFEWIKKIVFLCSVFSLIYIASNIMGKFKIISIIAIILVTFLPSWVYHIGVGQMYLLFLALIVLLHKKLSQFPKVTALGYAVLIFIKPTLIVFLIPNYKTLGKPFIKYFIGAVFICSLISLSIFSKESQEYRKAMQQWTWEQIEPQPPDLSIEVHDPNYPFRTIDNSKIWKKRYFENTSIQSVFNYALNYQIPPSTLFALCCIAMLFFIVILMGVNLNGYEFLILEALCME